MYCTTVLSLLIWTQSVAAARIYVYQRADGTKVITDHVVSDPGLKLTRRFGIRVPDGNGTHSAFTTDVNRASKAYRSHHKYRPRKLISKFDELIKAKAREHGIDSSLVKAMVQIESSYNPRAVSRKGATGLLQLMPTTAARYGVNDRTNPDQNIDGGVRYLRDLLRLFKDNVRLAVAAYNAGENAVMRYDDVPPYRETRDYVHKVLELRKLYTSN